MAGLVTAAPLLLSMVTVPVPVEIVAFDEGADSVTAKLRVAALRAVMGTLMFSAVAPAGKVRVPCVRE